MIAGIQHLDGAALDHAERAFEYGRSCHAGLPRDTCKSPFGKFGEADGKIKLVLAQDVYCVVTAQLKDVKEVARTIDRDHYQWRIERK